MINIQDITPFMKKGWVAMDDDGFAVDDGYDYLIDNEKWEIIGNIQEGADLLENKG